MPSTDSQGYAAVGGEVNHHYFSTFGTAGLVSMLSIAGEVGSVLTFNSGATSPYTGGVYQTTPEQQLGSLAMANAGSQLGATGSRFLQPHLNRPNIITIAPGTRFDVFVNSDLILPGPYQDAAGQLINTAQH